MPIYNSGFLTDDYYNYQPPPIKGKAWRVIYSDVTDSYITHSVSVVDDNGKILNEYSAKKVLIEAPSRDRAQYASDLICAALCLKQGEYSIRTKVSPLDGKIDDSLMNGLDPILYTEGPVSTSNVTLACIIAAKISYRKKYQYACFKHFLSHEVFSTSIRSLDPSHWWSSKYVFNSAEFHVHAAYAIVSAYSVLEELGLEIRASQNKPSKINGEWNPDVKNELERRLSNAGVNLSDTILWTMRDTPTKIERFRKPRISTKAPWTYFKVRDSEIEIIDAIDYVSWLRSKISAHRLSELSGSLSYYDVVNVQHLARRLMLEHLGFWKGTTIC